MPMYDFLCTKCEHVFEEVIRSDAPSPPCPECGAPSERQIGAVAFKVKKQTKKGEYYTKKAKEEWNKTRKRVY